MGKILENIPKQVDPNIIVGWDTSDDTGVFKIRDDLALVQTVDIITPVSDDAYTYCQIAAANALSDVYAMGGRPLTALNICCVPFSKLPITTQYSRALDLVSQNLKGRAASTKKTAFFADSYEIASEVAPEREALLFDPQTSGGLLISVPRQKTDRMLDELHASGVSNAAIIGEVLASNSPGLEVI